MEYYTETLIFVQKEREGMESAENLLSFVLFFS